MSTNSLDLTFRILGATIERSIERTGADLVPLLSRLDSLRGRDELPPGRARDLELERMTWIREIRDGLLLDSQEEIAVSLRASRGARAARDDPWADLDPSFVAAREASCALVWTKAQLEATGCCQRYRDTGRVSYLRAALARLEGASRITRAGRPTRLTVRTSHRERERLGAALDAALDIDARAFFARHVREGIGGFEQHVSDERWTVGRSYYLRDLGTVFAPPLQSVYDAARIADERERADARRLAEEHEAAMRTRLASASETGIMGASDGPGGLPERPDQDVTEQDLGQTEAEWYAAQGLVPVELPDQGLVYLEPAMATSCLAELARRKRWAEERAAREEVRRWYYTKIGRPYPD